MTLAGHLTPGQREEVRQLIVAELAARALQERASVEVRRRAGQAAREAGQRFNVYDFMDSPAEAAAVAALLEEGWTGV
jgi:hypothetical protein